MMVFICECGQSKFHTDSHCIECLKGIYREIVKATVEEEE